MVSLSLWRLAKKDTVDKQRDGEGTVFCTLTPILAAQEVQAGGENDEALKKERGRNTFLSTLTHPIFPLGLNSLTRESLLPSTPLRFPPLRSWLTD